MTNFLQDVRYAFRQLGKSPGFTVTAVLTLALGIGANAAIFTLVNAVLLKSLPVADPAALVRIGDEDQCCVGSGAHDSGDYAYFSTNTYQQFKQNNPEFAELAAMESGFEYRPLTARRDATQEAARSVMAEFVSCNYFRTFGLRPAEGRLMTDSDDVEGAPFTAVMSYEEWRDDYNSDPSVVGSTFWMNTKPVTITGIAPEGFYGDRLTSAPPQFYLPMNAESAIKNTSYEHDPDTSWLWIIGRLKPGVVRAPLQQKLSAQLRQIFVTNKDFSSAHDKPLLAKVHVGLTDGGAGIAQMQTGYGTHLKLLMWISGLVLLIACANVANLLLVRGMGRKAEMAVRTALGAARGRIVRQLLTESLLLAALSGLAALALSYGGARMLLMLAFPGQQHVPISSAPSLTVLAFAVGVSLLTAILFGVAPAFIAAQAEPADVLRSGTRTTTGGASLLQRTLVVTQAGLSLVLLVGAGLFAQNLSKLQRMDMKLDATNRYIVHFNPQAAGYGTLQVEALYRTIEDQFHAIPGVVKVGLTTYTPMEDDNWGNSVQIEGQPDLHKGASFVKATREYFDSVGTRVVMGRGIGVQDTMSSPPVAVVNQSFVKTFFKPGENPIGHRFGAPGPKSDGSYEIVGVVEDTAYTTVKWKDHTMYFVPLTQRPASDPSPVANDVGFYAGALVIQTARPMPDMESIARRTLSSINPNLAVGKFQTFSAQIAGRFVEERMLSRLMMLFGGLALLLASVGLYGVTAYTVARRTSEIGIRMALGAERGGVVAMILRSALAQTLLGLAIGVPIAYYCVRFVKSQLYEMDSVSASAMAVAVVTLLTAAFLAGLIPARRAASIEPAQALRSE